MDDATLDQFGGGDDGAGTDGDADPSAPDEETGDTRDDAAGADGDASAAAGADGDDGAGTDAGDGEAVTPAVSTFAWAPDGAACAACGAAVERRWRREAGLVCAACADWE